jgi:hypothetical protein
MNNICTHFNCGDERIGNLELAICFDSLIELVSRRLRDIGSLETRPRIVYTTDGRLKARWFRNPARDPIDLEAPYELPERGDWVSFESVSVNVHDMGVTEMIMAGDPVMTVDDLLSFIDSDLKSIVGVIM